MPATYANRAELLRLRGWETRPTDVVVKVRGTDLAKAYRWYLGRADRRYRTDWPTVAEVVSALVAKALPTVEKGTHQ